MSQIKTIFKNMSWLMISQIISGICGFIWTILIARYLGVSDYGILGFAISLTSILSVLLDLGIGPYALRIIATDYGSAPKNLGNVIPLRFVFATTTFILTLIILILMRSDELTITITLLFTIESIIKAFIGLLNGTFQAFEEGKYQGIGTTLLNLILLIFIIISVCTDFGIFGITISYILANLIALIYEYYVLVKHITRPKFEIDWDYCKKITISSLPFALTGILSSVYYSIDVVMLSHFVGSYATGIYNAAYKLISVLTLFYSVYTAVFFPVMIKFFKNNKKLLTISYEKSIKYLMIIIIPIAVATMFYSTDLINLFFGNEYDAASSSLSILIWTVCLLFISGIGNTLLNASHKEVSVTKIYAIAAVVNVVINIFLIPYYSYNGAAIATVLSDLAIVMVQTYLIHKLGHKLNKKLYSDLLKIICGSAVLGIAIYFLNLNMWLALPIGIVIYFIIIYLLNVFDNDDKYIIKEILGRK